MRATNKRRADIQGLRALAVIAVVLDHAFGVPRGGFLGVDVFFVVSGFVITAQLLDDRERRGRWALGRFWWRRVARLAPALVVVVVITTATIALTVPGRLPGLTIDAASALLSVANWRFIQVGTDYFGAFAATSPLQHTWSLSVEEQFYLVWPVLLLTTFTIVRRRTGAVRLGDRRAAVALGALLMTASIAIAAASLADPAASYFSTASRAWEPLAGGLLALLARQGTLFDSSRWGSSGAAFGVALILASFVAVSPSVPSPVPAACAAVVGTCLVLAGRSRCWVRRALGWRPLVAVGNASYPIYLWHLPVLVIVTSVLPQSRWIALPLTASLAVLTHLLVEEPIRARAGRQHETLVEPRRPSGRTPTRARRAWIVALGAASTAAMVGGALWTHDPIRPHPVDRARSTAGPESAALTDRLAAALESSSWPKALVSQDPALRGVRSCGDRTERPAVQSCSFGASVAPNTAVLVGDSIAGAWSEALVPLIEDSRAWRLIALPRNGCPFVDLELAHAPGRDCAAERAAVLDRIESIKPELVIVSSRDHAVFRTSGGEPASDQQVAHGAATLHRRLMDHSGRVVVLTAPPTGADLRACRTTIGSPADCVASVRPGTRADALARAAASAGTTVVDTGPLVSVDHRTPAFVGDLAVREDTVHLTPAFSRSIGPALAEHLTAIGVDLRSSPTDGVTRAAPAQAGAPAPPPPGSRRPHGAVSSASRRRRDRAAWGRCLLR